MTAPATPAVGQPSTGRAADPADQAAAALLADVVGRLVRMLRRSHVVALGPASVAALATVVRSGKVRLGDLAELEGVTPAALSRVVAALERDGLVERSPDPGDRRSAFVSATALGLRASEQVRSARAAVLVERISRLGAAERDSLVAGLGVLERIVSEPEPAHGPDHTS